MAYLTDLQPCTYLPIAENEKILAIGWLENDQAYTAGSVDESFFIKLCQLIKNPWQSFVALGWHDCSLCQFSGGANASYRDNVIVGRSGNNLFVPGTNVIYAAPVMVAHYIDAHRYRPPDVFIEAVNNCPEMRSVAYLKLLLANGGRALITSPDEEECLSASE